jgi:acyl dehydratase
MIDYKTLKNWAFGETVHRYSERDTMLYALGVGFGADPVNLDQLRFVYEKNLLVVPTMASILGMPGFWWKDPRTGADTVKLLHGEQSLKLYGPLPTHGTVIARNRCASLTDKGRAKGALAAVTSDLFDGEKGNLLARGTSVSFLRGDGGFSEADGISDPAPAILPKPPQRAPDVELKLATVPQAALLYRLSGDYNDADLQVARRAGFPRPILHGLCTYGMACHAVLRACLAYDTSRLRGLAVRFTAPVYPGESLRFELWRAEDARTWNLRAHVDARKAVVLDKGLVEID